MPSNYSTNYDELFKKLTGLNIALTDINGDFRSTYDIMSDIASKWQYMTSMEQAASATGICTYTGDYTTKVSFSLDTELPKIKKVIFNKPATIVIWDDKTKTIVKCQDGDVFDKEKGLAMAIVKKLYGENRGKYNNIINKWVGNS